MERAIDHICFSGGAEGADSVFGEEAEKAGHKIIHYSFAGHYSSYKPHIYKLGPMLLTRADKHLKQANKTLKRKFPTGKVYMDNLLRRNYYQIKDTERVYAVSSLLDNAIGNAPYIKGGTAWAVQMAIDKGVPEIYFFDQVKTLVWFKLGQHGFQVVSDPPRPYGKYTGIGSRELNIAGESAIRALYEIKMRKFVINFGAFTSELDGESVEDALIRAGYDPQKTQWTLLTVRDVEDNED